MSTSTDRAARVFAYHERTKHHLARYAAALGYLDWDMQPDPFRTYSGAVRTELPLTADGVETRYADLYAEGEVVPEPLELDSIGAFFELALGITAWKELGESRWALRSDPSSGNLHPTEGYLITPELTGLRGGVHHYVSRDHCLEHRCRLDPEAAGTLKRWLSPAGFLVGISSIHWREAWKYGERAFRYCQHDVGHVLGTVRYAAAALGWSARLCDGLGDAHVARLLGLDRDEDFQLVDAHDREHPDAILLVTPGAGPPDVARLESSIEELTELLARGTWAGAPNVLSPAHVDWDAIDDAAAATWKPPSGSDAWSPQSEWTPLGTACRTPAATIIRQRRSALAFDKVTSITSRRFYSMLERLLPRRGTPPWDMIPWEPKLHLGLFVHRVEGLAPGLYVLERRAGVHERLVSMLGEKALWSTPPGCPPHLRLFCIDELDCRRTATSVSCNQDIAADGAFSLGMVAEFRETISSGAYWYRRLFWESGLIGQVLYLEAEAAGIRSTGIGCYFDDPFHQVLGLEGAELQSLYHFTVGGPVEDTRLATHPAYAHLER